MKSTKEVESFILEVCESYARGSKMGTAKTFEDAGVLTMDKGVVLRLGENEFQIAIVRSKGDHDQDGPPD